MTITLTPGSQIRRGGVFQSTESLEGATATQAISVTTDVTELAASTATQGNFTLAAGVEGQEKAIIMTGTCTLNKVTPADAGQGYTAWLLSATDQFILARYINAAWHVMAHHIVASSATTATGVAVALYGFVT